MTVCQETGGTKSAKSRNKLLRSRPNCTIFAKSCQMIKYMLYLPQKGGNMKKIGELLVTPAGLESLAKELREHDIKMTSIGIWQHEPREADKQAMLVNGGEKINLTKGYKWPPLLGDGYKTAACHECGNINVLRSFGGNKTWCDHCQEFVYKGTGEYSAH